jgi:hypothetical protein
MGLAQNTEVHGLNAAVQTKLESANTSFPGLNGVAAFVLNFDFSATDLVGYVLGSLVSILFEDNLLLHPRSLLLTTGSSRVSSATIEPSRSRISNHPPQQSRKEREPTLVPPECFLILIF